MSRVIGPRKQVPSDAVFVGPDEAGRRRRKQHLGEPGKQHEDKCLTGIVNRVMRCGPTKYHATVLNELVVNKAGAAR